MELPLLEKNFWAVYGDKGFMPLAVHIGEDLGNALQIAKDRDVTFPIAIDYENASLDDYTRIGEGINLFPLGYLFDKKGVVRHIYTVDEPPHDVLKADIEALIAE